MSEILLIVHVPLLVLLLLLIAIEIRTDIIPDTAIVLGTGGGLALTYFFGSQPWWSYWAGAVGGFAAVFTIIHLMFIKTGRQWIGLGLVKLFAVAGACIGLTTQLVNLLAFGMIYFVVMFLAQN